MAVPNFVDQSNGTQSLTNNIALPDDEDIFQCGRCKKQLTSLSTFLAHKNEQHCLRIDHSPYEHARLAHPPPTNTQYPPYRTDTSIQSKQHSVPFYGNAIQLSPVHHQNIVVSEDIISLHNLDTTLASVTADTSHTSGMHTMNTYTQPTQLTTLTLEQTGNPPLMSPLDTTTHQFYPIRQGVSCTIPEQYPNYHVAQTCSTSIASTHITHTPQYKEAMDKLPPICNLSKPVVAKTERKCVRDNQREFTSTRPQFFLNRTNSSKKCLICQYCKKEFTKNFDLQQHVRSHTGERPFQCIVCGRGFAQKSNVKKHMATHKVWPCGNSNSLPKQPIILETTVDKQHPISDSTQVNTKSHQVLQEMSIGKATDMGGQTHIVLDNSYICQYCSMKFKTYYALKSHMVVHKSNQVYKCVLRSCGETFHELDDFLSHTKTHEEVLTYRCHVCTETFTSLCDLGSHQLSHSSCNTEGPMKPSRFRPYVCTKCQNKYASPEALEHHMATTDHHFPCSVCGKVLSCERFLRRHLHIHGSTTPYKCSTCGKKFKTENYLKMHLVCHSSERPYQCNVCPAAFNRRDKLKRHQLIHDPVKKYTCPFTSLTGCMKAFTRPDKLKAHLVIHSGLRPYTCKTCSRTFPRPAALKEHEKIHISSSKSECNKCKKHFHTESMYRKHKCADTKIIKVRPFNKRKVGRPRKKMITVIQERLIPEKRRFRGRPRKIPQEDIVTVEVSIEKANEENRKLKNSNCPVLIVDGQTAMIVKHPDNTITSSPNHNSADSPPTSDTVTVTSKHVDNQTVDNRCLESSGIDNNFVTPTPERNWGQFGLPISIGLEELHEYSDAIDTNPMNNVQPSETVVSDTSIASSQPVNSETNTDVVPLDHFNQALRDKDIRIVTYQGIHDTSVSVYDSHLCFPHPTTTQILQPHLSQVVSINAQTFYPLIVDERGAVLSVLDNGTTVPAPVVLVQSTKSSGQYVLQPQTYTDSTISA